MCLKTAGSVTYNVHAKQTLHSMVSHLGLHCLLWDWLGEAKVSCILRHRGVQLRLAYS